VLFPFVSNAVYTSDYMMSTNCFDELFLHLILMSWIQVIEYWTLWIVQLLWRALHFINDNGNVHYNLVDANYTEEKH